MPDYAYRYSQMAVHGDDLIIAGRCGSSCTLFFGFLSPDHYCATPDAKLQFHQASGPEGTAYFRQHYPPALNRWIDANGGLTKDVIALQGAELRRFVPLCPGSPMQALSGPPQQR